MAHMIGKGDKQQGTEMAWHKLTEVSKDLHARFMAKTSHLDDWDAVKTPLFIMDINGKPIQTDSCAIVCTDNLSHIIGKPVDCITYGMVTNAQFTNIVRNAIQEVTSAEVVSVGSVCARGRIFVSIKLTEQEEFTAAGRKFNPFLNFLSSHDLSSVLLTNASNTCTVCNNTFSFNLHDKNAQVFARLKHTKNVVDRLENIPQVISGFLGAQARFKIQMEKLAVEHVTVDDANALFAGFLSPKIEEMSARKANQVDRLTSLFLSGLGNEGRNMADAFSAITDYYSHESAGGDENRVKQFISSEYGSGQTAKARFWDLLESGREKGEAIARGREVLALS